MASMELVCKSKSDFCARKGMMKSSQAFARRELVRLTLPQAICWELANLWTGSQVGDCVKIGSTETPAVWQVTSQGKWQFRLRPRQRSRRSRGINATRFGIATVRPVCICLVGSRVGEAVFGRANGTWGRNDVIERPFVGSCVGTPPARLAPPTQRKPTTKSGESAIKESGNSP
jgi:hypothetical protein